MAHAQYTAVSATIPRSTMAGTRAAGPRRSMIRSASRMPRTASSPAMPSAKRQKSTQPDSQPKSVSHALSTEMEPMAPATRPRTGATTLSIMRFNTTSGA